MKTQYRLYELKFELVVRIRCYFLGGYDFLDMFKVQRLISNNLKCGICDINEVDGGLDINMNDTKNKVYTNTVVWSIKYGAKEQINCDWICSLLMSYFKHPRIKCKVELISSKKLGIAEVLKKRIYPNRGSVSKGYYSVYDADHYPPASVDMGEWDIVPIQ